MSRTVWSNQNLDYENDWAPYLKEEYPGLSDYDYERLMWDINGDYLADERINLDVELNHPILVIADLGLWNGRAYGYKELPGNIKECLYSDCEYVTWYVDDDGEFCCNASHHDGTNHYRYRTYKSGVSEWQIDKLKSKIYDGTATEEDIDSVTRKLGYDIAEVYGWEMKEAV